MICFFLSVFFLHNVYIKKREIEFQKDLAVLFFYMKEAFYAKKYQEMEAIVKNDIERMDSPKWRLHLRETNRKLAALKKKDNHNIIDK